MKKSTVITIIAAAIFGLTSCKKDDINATYERGAIVKFSQSDCTINGNPCSTLARIDSIDTKHSHGLYNYNFYHITTNDGVDMAAGVPDYKTASNPSAYTYVGKSKYIPFINNICHLKSDTAYWVSQGFKIADFETILHLK